MLCHFSFGSGKSSPGAAQRHTLMLMRENMRAIGMRRAHALPVECSKENMSAALAKTEHRMTIHKLRLKGSVHLNRRCITVCVVYTGLVVTTWKPYGWWLMT